MKKERNETEKKGKVMCGVRKKMGYKGGVTWHKVRKCRR